MHPPVLIIAFNRPELAQRLLEALSKTRPPKLYIAVDGPRDCHPKDIERCASTRQLAASIPWPCQVKTLFHKRNLGCRHGPISAINWFFQNEAEGIILEDDCIPHPDFFEYCRWGLETYREYKEVWHLNGSNFHSPSSLFDRKSTGFSALAQVWGWATWRDRWQRYEGNPYYLGGTKAASAWPLSKRGELNMLRNLEKLKVGLDAWDHQWQIAILQNKGLALCCAANLISNIGDGIEATHTGVDKRTHLATKELARPLHRIPLQANPKLTRWYERQMGLLRVTGVIRYRLSRVWPVSKSFLCDSLSILLFGKPAPIVVASTGRSGSTLLFDSIAEGCLRKRFRLGSSVPIPRFLRKAAQVYTDRLSSIGANPQPVHKTHDLPPENLPPQVKCLFVYGDPLEAAQSALQMTDRFGHAWLDEHLYHLRSRGAKQDLLEKDVLNFEAQLERWCDPDRESTLALHYDALWQETDRISRFLGFPITLPPRQARSAKPAPETYNKPLFERLREKMKLRAANKIISETAS